MPVLVRYPEKDRAQRTAGVLTVCHDLLDLLDRPKAGGAISSVDYR
ncbi:hypothetical protein [Nocardia asiatica]